MAALLGVVVPVKRLDDAACEILAASAHAAPALEFVAVGDGAAAPGAPANLKVVSARCGLYEAMNVGIGAATADYLLFMGIDDRLIAENVAAAQAALARAPRSALVALPYVYRGKRYRLKPGRTGARAFHHQGVLFDRVTASRLGGYSAQYPLHADLDLMFRMQQAGPAGWIDIPLAEFREGGVTTTGERSLESIREINRIYKAHGASRIDRMFFFSVVNLAWFGIRRRLLGSPGA
jgi:hypothetical protein